MYLNSICCPQQDRDTLQFPYQVVAEGAYKPLSKLKLAYFDGEILTVIGDSDRAGLVCSHHRDVDCKWYDPLLG